MRILLLTLVLPLCAQTSVPGALAKHWRTAGEFTLAVAEAMPPDSYSFRPTPQEMSFGQLMAHIAGVNQNACANASGLARPTLLPKIAEWAKDTEKVEIDKETALSFLASSFEFCYRAVAATTPERMDQIVGPPARNLTGYEWLWGYFTHTAHHRGQAEVYLRLKGIKPPEYKF